MKRVVYEESQVALAEPPTAAELAWWKQARKRIALRIGLGFGLPLGAVNVISSFLQDDARHPLLGAAVAIAIAAIGGWAVWRFSEEKYRNAEIRWKRMRDDIAGTGELPDGERGNSLQQ